MATIESVTFGRAKVKADASVFAQRFSETFISKRHTWAILSDYANLFAHIYRQKKGLSKIQPSVGAPLSLELVVFAFGELGAPSFTSLVGKVQKVLL